LLLLAGVEASAADFALPFSVDAEEEEVLLVAGVVEVVVEVFLGKSLIFVCFFPDATAGAVVVAEGLLEEDAVDWDWDLDFLALLLLVVESGAVVAAEGARR